MSVHPLPEMLHSFPALQRFVDLENEVQQIAALNRAHLENRWSISWLAITAPLKAILTLFLFVLSPLLHLFGQTDLARDAAVVATLSFLEVALVEKMWRYGEDLLSPLFAAYACSSRPIYLQPSIATQELQADPALFATVRDWDEIHFYQPAGVCRGVAIYFSTLYLRTKQHFPNAPVAHLRAISSLLSHGATSKPALFQSLCYTDPLVGINRREVFEENFGGEEGVYEIWLPTHRVVYIRVSADETFLVDPSIGVIALHGEAPTMRGRTFQLTLA